MTLTDSVTTLAGVGSIIATRLGNLGIKTIFDLLYHLPFRYEDRSVTSTIAQLQLGETVTVLGELDTIANAYTRRSKTLTVAQVHDATGKLQLVWFNQTYLLKALHVGQRYAFYGKVEVFNKKRTMFVPEHELADSDLHTNRIVPVYPETAGLTSRFLRTKNRQLLNEIEWKDFLPEDLHQLEWKTSMENIHFPKDLADVEAARRRLAFDEIFLLSLASLIHKQSWQAAKLAHSLAVDPTKIAEFIAKLPFSLTDAQQKALEQISHDLSQSTPMHRLLEGDVGSGKTVIAAAAAYIAAVNGFKTTVMAPTQILASQHFQVMQQFLTPFGLEVGLVTGSQKKVPPKANVIVGTQALIADKFALRDVALVIIDEQHRFGVSQRIAAEVKGMTPHVLTMTATPIPRTIALTLYGDLDLTVLDSSPPGRLPVKTWVVPEEKRQRAYAWIEKQISLTHAQAFVVCPLIEESESMVSVKAVSVEFERLKKVFPKHKVGLLHGRMKAKEKQAVLDAFRAGTLDMLVATPVVEVGVDIPGATIMVIEASHRFGLAQLHQLRGRVGRSSQQAYCLLFADGQTERLRAMETHHSGPELSEIDLKLRGPGEVFGTSQHGFSGFRVASYTDLELIVQAQKAALTVLPRLSELPLLRSLVEKDKIGLSSPN